MARIARNAAEVEAMVWEARKRTDAAEADGDTDEVADAIYTFGRWVLGDAERSEVEGFLADLDAGDDPGEG